MMSELALVIKVNATYAEGHSCANAYLAVQQLLKMTWDKPDRFLITN